MNSKELKTQADILKALSHPARLAIVKKLLKGPCCAKNANKAACLSQPNLSQHLRMLRNAKIVKFEKKGVKRCYCLTDKKKISLIIKAVDSMAASRQ